MIPPPAICDHCGLPAPSGRRIGDKVFCCAGCYLVSRLVGSADGQSQRAWDLLRLGVGAFLAMDVMMVSLLLYTNTVEADAVPLFHRIMLALSAVAMAVLVGPLVRGSWQEIRRGRLSLDTLIAVGSLAAFGVSAVGVLRGGGQVYFDTATMLPVLVTFGKLIEAAAKVRARELVQGLESLLPRTALRLGATNEEVPPSELRTGDRIRVRPGEAFAADGVIVEGRTRVEEAAFTGEPLARDCREGDRVLAGCVNGTGGVVVEAREVGGATLLARVVYMVQQAALSQGPYQRAAQKMAAVFTPAVLLLAAGAGVAWALAGDWPRGGMATLAVLVVACPCAMGIAAPLATAVAIAHAARQGVAVRGGEAMERLGQVTDVFLDKTGTLTLGEPTVREVLPADGIDANRLLAALAGLEAASEHPLAKAVLSEASRRGLPLPPVRDVQAVPGGITGEVCLDGQWRRVIAGSAELIRVAWRPSFAAMFIPATANPPTPGTTPGSANSGADSSDPSAHRGNMAANDGRHATPHSAIHVAVDEAYWGHVTVEDQPRSDAASAVEQLRALGVRVTLLSGDRAEAAEPLAARMGIDAVESRCEPGRKMELLRQARETNHAVTAMVGDGINDAPALAQADIGIAMGGGTDLAKRAGNVVLLSNRLEQVPWLIALSRRTRKVIWQNLAWALAYNAIALAAAAAGVLHPLLAAVAMIVSSLTLLGNSLRLGR